MSLKAKIEAVIYAAEEPVTVAQLVSLLSNEASVELERRRTAQQKLVLEEAPPPSEPDLLNDEILLIEEEDYVGDQEQESEIASNGQAKMEEIAPPVEASGKPAPAIEEDAVAAPGWSNDIGHTSMGLSRSTGFGSASDGGENTPIALDPKDLAREERERAGAVRDLLRQMLEELIRDYARSDRGLEVREVAGGFRLATKPEYHDAVRGFVKSLKPPLKLTLQALETLAVVAYKQPVTAPEISEIRGVDSGGVLGSLMTRKLVTTAGRKQVIGRPILYKTTKDFLLRFGLKDINELPSIEEFEKMAGELAESEPVQEEISMSDNASAESAHTDPELVRGNARENDPVTRENVEEEKQATEPQADGDGATVESVTPDGRLSGITPHSDTSGETDSSAAEAEIQKNESQE